jgi:hypothetical protein
VPRFGRLHGCFFAAEAAHRFTVPGPLCNVCWWQKLERGCLLDLQARKRCASQHTLQHTNRIGTLCRCEALIRTRAGTDRGGDQVRNPVGTSRPMFVCRAAYICERTHHHDVCKYLSYVKSSINSICALHEPQARVVNCFAGWLDPEWAYINCFNR